MESDIKKIELREKSRDRYHNNPLYRIKKMESARKYNHEHYQEIREKRKDYYKKYIREYFKDRYNSDPEFRAKHKEAMKRYYNKKKIQQKDLLTSNAIPVG